MRVVNERCAGLDVHKSSVMACAMVPEGKQLRAFGTTTAQLQQLANWLQRLEVSSVAMESSGIYWRPVFNLLEEAGFDLLVANARYMKAVPGRKTDVKDAEWIADLHRDGLLKASFFGLRPKRLIGNGRQVALGTAHRYGPRSSSRTESFSSGSGVQSPEPST